MRHKTGCALCLLALAASLGSCRSTQRAESSFSATERFDSLRVNSRFALQADSLEHTKIIFFDSLRLDFLPDTSAHARVGRLTARRALVISQTTQTAKAQTLRKDSTRAAMHRREQKTQSQKEREPWHPPALWGFFAALLIIIGIALWRFRK